MRRGVVCFLGRGAGERRAGEWDIEAAGPTLMERGVDFAGAEPGGWLRLCSRMRAEAARRDSIGLPWRSDMVSTRRWRAAGRLRTAILRARSRANASRSLRR